MEGVADRDDLALKTLCVRLRWQKEASEHRSRANVEAAEQRSRASLSLHLKRARPTAEAAEQRSRAHALEDDVALARAEGVRHAEEADGLRAAMARLSRSRGGGGDDAGMRREVERLQEQVTDLQRERAGLRAELSAERSGFEARLAALLADDDPDEVPLSVSLKDDRPIYVRGTTDWSIYVRGTIDRSMYVRGTIDRSVYVRVRGAPRRAADDDPDEVVG
ncbi:hypothetical protein T484DRAFT_1880361 [Baffinella frigidus]|nr:hypothetical protein T484DRAFT_1880361 [Cryptophyta sp. CCMP2293]